jgi:hypothetical protein
MNLKHIKFEAKFRKRGEFISLQKSGLIAFSKDAVIANALKTGSKVIFLQDNDRPKDWYIQITDDGDCELREMKADMLCINANCIVLAIKESLESYTDKAFRISLGKAFQEDGKTLIALLAAKL